MAKAAATTKEIATAGPATEEEVFEVPVLDEEDERLLATPEPEASVRGAEEGEEEAEQEPEKPEVPAAKAKAAKAAPEPIPAPAPAAAPKAEAEAEPEKPVQRPLTPIERQERQKRKDYAKKWQQALEEIDRLQARVTEISREIKVGETKIPKERLEALRAEADKADGLGKVAELSVSEAARMLDERDKQWAERFTAHQRQTHIQVSEVAARVRHSDYDEQLTKAGIFAALRQREDGSYPNPYLARKILLSADPGEEAYQLAVGRLEHERAQQSEPAEEEAPMADENPKPVAAPKAEAAPASPPAKPKAEEAEVEAERRGAKRVVEQVAANAQRPKGIAGLRSAGAPKAAWSKAELDALMRDNPARYEALMDKHPNLLRFHLS